MSGIVVNYLLLIISVAVLENGFKFFINYKATARNIRLTILFLSIYSSLWCLSYGLIGVTDDLTKAPLYRIFGVLAIDGFFSVEVFLVSFMSKAKKPVVILAETISVILAAFDFVTFSNVNVDTFIRIGNWTTWYFNPQYSMQHNVHSFVVLFMVADLLTVGIIWAKNNKFKRQRKFIRLVFAANFLMFFFTFPDTYFPLLGQPAIATSGIGSAACTFVILYGATILNSFNIQMGDVAHNIYSFIDAGVIAFDLDYRLVLANPYIQEKFPLKELMGARLVDLFEVDEEENCRIFEESKKGIVNARWKSRYGESTYSVRVKVAMDNYKEPYCYIVAVIDVTEELNMVKELEIANNAKTLFLTSVSHEIRTPLNAVLSFNEIIRRNAKNAEIISCAENISISGKLLLSFVNDLLDMGKLSTGKMELLLGEYELSELISGIIMLHYLRAEDKGLFLDVNYDRKMPRKLVGDSVKIQQIISNLVSNAIKYTPTGTVRFTVGYEQVSEDQIILQITVSDTGMGIKEENLPYIFDSFRRFDEEKNRHIEGIGLGLAITHNIVQLMDGSISVESEYGKGTTFYVTLPQKIADAEPIGEILFTQQKEEATVEKMIIAPRAQILLVDDNNLNLKAFCVIVKHTKMQIDTATSGMEALNRIKEKHYDLIFMDHMMPELDGVDTLKLIRSSKDHKNVDTPVVVMTANAVVGAREEYLKEGFSDYISKPLDILKLEDIICNLLPEDLVEYVDEEAKPEALNNNILPVVRGVDWSLAYRNVPDMDGLIDVVVSFCQSAEKDIFFLHDKCRAIAEKQDEDSLTEYRIRVHALKNSAAVIGAMDLSNEAKKLEEAAKKHDFNTIIDNNESFMSHFGATAMDIWAALSQKGIIADQTSIIVMDNETLKQKVILADEAMKNLDTLALNDICFELDQQNYQTRQIHLLVHKLCDAFRDFDEESFFEAVKELLEEL